MSKAELKKLDKWLVAFQKHLNDRLVSITPDYTATIKVRKSVDREIVKLEALRTERKERRAG